MLTLYAEIDAPFEAGTDQLNITLVPLLEMINGEGWLGTSAVRAKTSLDNGPTPKLLIAAILNQYVFPVIKLVI